MFKNFTSKYYDIKGILARYANKQSIYFFKPSYVSVFHNRSFMLVFTSDDINTQTQKLGENGLRPPRPPWLGSSLSTFPHHMTMGEPLLLKMNSQNVPTV